MSRGGSEKSVGASVQQEGEERRERADCAFISETLNAQIDPLVIKWFFGDVPILARVAVDSPKNEDRTVLANVVGDVVNMGARVPIASVLKRLNVPQAGKDDEVFTAPVAAVEVPGGSTLATNRFSAPLPQHLASARASVHAEVAGEIPRDFPGIDCGRSEPVAQGICIRAQGR